MKKAIFKNFLIIFGATASLLLAYFAYQIEKPLSLEGEPKVVEIKRGTGFLEIAQQLEKEGIIRSKNFFKIYVLFKGWQKKLKAGKYSLCPCFSISEVAQKLVKGERKEEVEVTIVEGWSIFEIDKKLSEEGVIKPGSLIFYQVSEEEKRKYPFLLEAPENTSLEGFLFPDTYRFFRNESKDVSLVVDKFLKNFDRKVYQKYRQEVERKSKKFYEVLILASLLEKEVVRNDEKKIAAGILWKRYEKNKPLEVDATILYAKQKKLGKTWKEVLPLKKEDFLIDSPYNTYRFKGLPPTPICNPSLASFKAALYPKDSPYLYYLSDPKTKKTYFSSDYKTHLYLRKKFLNL
ncbi:endolytic transglycosylase MltG [bacterium]|nr:endolytic transglycosylase MltG [bacterium]